MPHNLNTYYKWQMTQDADPVLQNLNKIETWDMHYRLALIKTLKILVLQQTEGNILTR